MCGDSILDCSEFKQNDNFVAKIIRTRICLRASQTKCLYYWCGFGCFFFVRFFFSCLSFLTLFYIRSIVSCFFFSLYPLFSYSLDFTSALGTIFSLLHCAASALRFSDVEKKIAGVLCKLVRYRHRRVPQTTKR